MSNAQSTKDPLEFVRGMWSNMGFNLPGMVTPTLDVDELDKRIADMKAVEGWLKMNLNMLQMTIQGLDMQRATIATVKAMCDQMQENGEQTGSGKKTESGDANPFAAAAAMWPWNMMTPGQGEASTAPAQAQTDAVPPAASKSADKMWPWNMMTPEQSEPASATPETPSDGKPRARRKSSDK
ncbi:MAG: hypothetical protein Q7J47_05630 [Azoarcus sp.]|nr:hypothetical protein [Azoarcus sp.]